MEQYEKELAEISAQYPTQAKKIKPGMSVRLVNTPGTTSFINILANPYNNLGIATILDHNKVKITDKSDHRVEITTQDNQVTVNLSESGTFLIDIPVDASLEADFDNVNVMYSCVSTRKTILDITCGRVNIPGDSGSYNDGKEHWLYYLGKTDDPQTSIKTQGEFKIDGYEPADQTHWKLTKGL
jgi:hypothetical protein